MWDKNNKNTETHIHKELSHMIRNDKISLNNVMVVAKTSCHRKMWRHGEEGRGEVLGQTRKPPKREN